MTTTITPYLPPEGETAARAWTAGGKLACIRAYEMARNTGECPNCQGHGAVHLLLMESGPHKFVPSGIATWFAGDGQNGKGWYVVKETLGYPCPECGG